MTAEHNRIWATLTLKTESIKQSAAKKHILSTVENTVIGRSPDCQIALDPHEFVTVSRRHAEIKLVDASWQINDLGTTNGTLVNDRPVSNNQRLESGDRIILGAKGPEFSFECLTLNATVMVQPTEIEVDIPEPEPSPSKSENKPIETPEVVVANVTIPAVQEIVKDPEPAQAPIAKNAKDKVKEKKLSAENESIAEPKPEAKKHTPARAVDNATVSKTKTTSVSKLVNTSPNTLAFDSGKSLWNLISATELCQIAEKSQSVLALAFSPDAQVLVSVAKDKTIKLWNISNQTEIATLTGHKLAANAIAFSPDGQILASAGADKTIKLWNIDNQAEIASFSGHKLAIESLAFSPDGQILASAGADKTIKLWNIDNQAEIASFSGHKLAIESLAFSPDGQILASGSKDKTIRLWNVANQEEIAVLAGHKQGISSINFSPDGQTIASAGADQTIRLWNKKTQLEIAAIATPSWQTGAIAIAVDGKTLAGIDEQGAIRLWQI
ncbi:MAG TPA: FHA domain-containing protein [Coleofasciculaceae cyanobacterium]|jgi:WD40 repeat protein/pSer/pThr/pTyr-binding forkhead associated (FHA) protein